MMNDQWKARMAAGWLLLTLTSCAQAGGDFKDAQSAQRPAPARDPIVGTWSWFVGGAVTIRANGMLVQDQGNDGSWERRDPARQVYILRWRLGGFVDTITLAEDGQSLAGTNQFGVSVTAQKIRSVAPPGPVPPARDQGQAPLPPQNTSAPPPAVDPAAEQPFRRGVSLFESHQYAAALPALLDAAQRGHPRAQALLGRMYREGLGVAVNERQAVSWFGQAAAQGHRGAQFALGSMYEEGEGVPKDVQKAAQLYEASARQGYDKAQFALGLSYEFGQGVPRDRRTAIYWLMQAAKQGDGRARWIAEWLRRPDTPHLRNEIQLANHINAKMAPPPPPAGSYTGPNVARWVQQQQARDRAHEAEKRGDKEGARLIRSEYGIR
jgi:TPR repeat protein